MALGFLHRQRDLAGWRQFRLINHTRPLTLPPLLMKKVIDLLRHLR